MRDGRKAKKNEKEEKIDKKIFAPVKEQLLMLIEYISLFDYRNDLTDKEKITLVIEMIQTICKQSEVYLYFNFLKENKDDRNFAV